MQIDLNKATAEYVERAREREIARHKGALFSTTWFEALYTVDNAYQIMLNEYLGVNSVGSHRSFTRIEFKFDDMISGASIATLVTTTLKVGNDIYFFDGIDQEADIVNYYGDETIEKRIIVLFAKA